MELIDNISRLLGDDLKQTLRPGARLKVAASCFSMYAFEALKAELEKIDELDFIFTSPTFVANEVTDKIRKERKEFHIPKLDRERSLYGSEFEIQLRNKLTQRAVAKECADWIRRKAKFRSNRTRAPMQQFACVQAGSTDTAYMPLHGFTAVDLGYQQGNAVSNLVNKMDEAPFAATYQKLMNKVIREGVKTKVLMLSATPVNNRFTDLRNQLALAYEGDSENLSKKLRTSKSVEEVFRNAHLRRHQGRQCL